MMKYLKKHKLLVTSVLLLVFLVGCKRVVGDNGIVLPQFEFKLDTPFATAWNEGIFAAFITYPLSYVLNFLAQFLGAGGSLIVVTLIVNALLTPLMIKQQLMTQVQTLIQPEMSKINAKYASMPQNQQNTLKKSQEIQALWKKYNINPLSSLLPLLVQMPLLFGMYAAVQRAHAIAYGEFLGMQLSVSPGVGFKTSMMFLVVFALNIILQIISIKLPQYLAKRKKKELNIKDKPYAQDKNTPNPETTMNTMLIVMIVMTAFFGWTWPVGMSLYWAVGSFARILQALYIHKFHSINTKQK